MGTSTVKKDDDFPMLNTTNELEGLKTKKTVRECDEIIGSTYGGSVG
jgi:hypothetical protein